MTVEFENHRVRVTRRTASDHYSEPAVSRSDRLVIWLRDGGVERHSDGKHETLRRRAGEFVWRDASDHVVTPHTDVHEVLIIELKDV